MKFSLTGGRGRAKRSSRKQNNRRHRAAARCFFAAREVSLGGIWRLPFSNVRDIDRHFCPCYDRPVVENCLPCRPGETGGGGEITAASLLGQWPNLQKGEMMMKEKIYQPAGSGKEERRHG